MATVVATELATSFQLREESKELMDEMLATFQKHTREDGPKVAIVQFFINRIFHIDDVNQRMECDFYLKVNWIDPKYINVSDDAFQAEEKKEFWQPGVEVTNGIDLQKLIEGDEAYWVEYPPAGVLAYTQRYVGNVDAPMDLRDFPFDMQTLTITFESFHWKADDLLLVGLPRHRLQRSQDGYTWSGMSNKVRLPDWQVRLIETKEINNYYKFEDRNYAQVEAVIYVERREEYYVTQMISLLGIVTAMAWVAFFFNVMDFGNRINYVITLFLALVAFHFVISTSLPKVSYWTRLSRYLFATYVVVVLVLLQGVIEHVVEQLTGSDPADMKSVAKIFDWSCLGLFGVGFIIYNTIFGESIRHMKKKRAQDLAAKK